MSTRAEDMTYLSYGSQIEPPRKLVVLVHGYGRNASYMKKMADEVVQTMPDAVVVCPQGIEPFEKPADPDSSEEQFQWFSMEGDLYALYPRLTAAAAALNHFIDQQRDLYKLGDREIAVMGFSQGASLSLYASFTRASEIAGVACHSSILLSRPEGDALLKSKPRTLFVYGSNDQVFSQDMFRDSFRHISKWTGNATEYKADGLDHSTNRETRAACARFIQACFKP